MHFVVLNIASKLISINYIEFHLTLSWYYILERPSGKTSNIMNTLTVFDPTTLFRRLRNEKNIVSYFSNSATKHYHWQYVFFRNHNLKNAQHPILLTQVKIF